MLYVHYFTVSALQENSYLVYNDEGDAAIIDPGFYTAAEQALLSNFIETKKLRPRLLLLTHSHLDHVFGLKWAAEKYSLLPHVHENEKQMLAMAPTMGEMWGQPFEGYTGELIFYKPNQVLALGADQLTVLDTPGHSPGHVVFATNDFVIAGDTLFNGSIGRTDLPGGHHQTLIESIREKLFTLPNDTIVYPGHGPATTIGHEKKHNPFVGVLAQ